MMSYRPPKWAARAAEIGGWSIIGDMDGIQRSVRAIPIIVLLFGLTMTVTTF